MSGTVQSYLNLITSEHSEQPNFMAMVAGVVAPFVQVQNLLTSMIPIFDIDLSPVGNQLDIIGQWVGVSRNLSTPITGVFFTWNGAADQGWNYGVWQDPSNPTAVTVLPDDVYLTLIRARIAANHWDGTTEGAYAIWAILFPTQNILIQDNQNMSFGLGLQGVVPDSLTLALFTGGYLPLKPGAIRISEYFIPVDTNPLFAWGTDANPVSSSFLSGWGVGSWAMEVAPT